MLQTVSLNTKYYKPIEPGIFHSPMPGIEPRFLRHSANASFMLSNEDHPGNFQKHFFESEDICYETNIS